MTPREEWGGEETLDRNHFFQHRAPARIYKGTSAHSVRLPAAAARAVMAEQQQQQQQKHHHYLVRKFCLGLTLSCGCTLAGLVLLFTVLTTMRLEHIVRQAWSQWVHG